MTEENWSKVGSGRWAIQMELSRKWLGLVVNILNHQKIEPFHLHRTIKVFYENWNSSSERELCCRKPEMLVCKSFTCELGDQSSNLWPEAGRKWIWGHLFYLSGRYLNHRHVMYSKEALPHVGANGLN